MVPAVQEGTVFHLHQGGADADLFPHGCCQPQHFLHPLGCGIGIADRQLESARIPGFLKQLPGLCRIEGDFRQAGIMSLQPPGEDAVFQNATVADGCLHQGLTIQRQLQRLADPHILQRRQGLVEGDIGDAHAVTPDHVLPVNVPPQEILSVNAQFVQIQDIQLPVEEHLAQRAVLRVKMHGKAVAFGRAGPAFRVGFHNDAFIFSPFRQHKGTGPDGCFRRPAEGVSRFQRGLFVKDGGSRRGQSFQEGGAGVGEGYGKGQVVDDFKSC